MIDYYNKLSGQNVRSLNDHLGILGGKKMIEGIATYLGDVKLADAIQFLKQTDLYKTGEYKDINADGFAGVFEKVGLTLDKSINENAVLIGKLHLGKFPFFQRESLAFLRSAFKISDNAVDPKLLSDAAQLLQHVLHIVSESPSCHQDFDDTKLSYASPEHVRFLTLG